MKRLLTNAILFIAILGGVSAGVFVHSAQALSMGPNSSSHFAAADPLKSSKDNVCSGVALTGASCSTSSGGITRIIRTVISILSLIVGVAAVVMIIVGGLKYITSGGDSNSVSSAKNTIIYAVVGLVIVALAQAIVHFVLDKVK